MTVAVMQPYLFPYLGYYQLLDAVDEFVFFDDVNFINKGWINRNQILQVNEPLRFTVPLAKASQNSLINQIGLADFESWKKTFLKTVELNYKRAPYFKVIFEWLKYFLNEQNYKYISNLASDSIMAVALLLGLSTRFKYSSTLSYRSEGQDGPQKILSICSLVGAHSYVNPKNGAELYERHAFQAKQIQLFFIHMEDVSYRQFKDNFVPNLSILDVLMFNTIEETKTLLKKYQLT